MRAAYPFVLLWAVSVKGSDEETLTTDEIVGLGIGYARSELPALTPVANSPLEPPHTDTLSPTRAGQNGNSLPLGDFVCAVLSLPSMLQVLPLQHAQQSGEASYRHRASVRNEPVTDGLQRSSYAHADRPNYSIVCGGKRLFATYKHDVRAVNVRGSI